MNLRNFSTLGRPLDMNYPTNWAIAVLVGIVMMVFFVVQWMNAMPLLSALAWSVQAGIGVFLAWAIGRELDPDHDLSAFVSAALMVALLWRFPLPNLLMLFWLMLLIRLLNRSVGLTPMWMDLVGIFALAAWLCWQEGWMYGLLTAMVFLLNQFALKTSYKAAWPFVISLGITILFLGLNPTLSVSDFDQSTFILGWLVLIFFMLTTVISEKIKSVGDETGKTLSEKRVKAAQWAAAFVALVLLLLQGETGSSNVLPLWTSMAGATLFMLWRRSMGLFSGRRSG